MRWIIEDIAKIDEVASDFIKKTEDKTLYAFYGPMGVGKTTFVKAIARVMGITDEVSSPTFAIVNEYQNGIGKLIYHFDFYRLNDIYEALDFGVEEYFYSGHKCFMEWPEKIEQLLPEETVNCYFTEREDGKREIVIR